MSNREKPQSIEVEKTRPTPEDIKKIIQDEKVDLSKALRIFAERLSDYHSYTGPYKEVIIGELDYQTERSDKFEKRTARKEQLLAEGKSIFEVKKILESEDLWQID